MTDYEREVFRRTLQKHGPDHQQKVLVEEMAELTQAICKYWRGKAVYDNIAEEIADVSIMLDQMQLLFQCGGQVQAYRMKKVQ